MNIIRNFTVALLALAFVVPHIRIAGMPVGREIIGCEPFVAKALDAPVRMGNGSPM
jgi:hypothetical protein